MSLPFVKHTDLGTVDYKEAWDYQGVLFNEIIQQKISEKDVEHKSNPLNHLITCQHPHVFTIGKSGNESNLLANEKDLDAMEATFYKINRGGDITYHGPGQLVVYPIFDLDQFFTDIHKYMRFLEESVILTLLDFGITGTRMEGLTGVWIADEIPRKICAFGVKSSRWVTMHGIGFNVNTDLSYFDSIVPCGITGKEVTSMKQEIGTTLDLQEVQSRLLYHLKTLFGYVETE
ncbi:MAG: lipoyl(octanoyl) transferase LipB [Flavobacteriia bacterium]|jgi:lipoyl(octanoyl) transferase|nr:lipoyl(octanoyl) transferase LipB [Flavobacteriia bacterium]